MENRVLPGPGSDMLLTVCLCCFRSKRELKQAAAEAASTSAGLSQLTGPDTSINPTSGPLMSYDTEFNFEVNKLTIEEYQREMLFEGMCC